MLRGLMDENLYSHNSYLAEIARALESAFPDAGIVDEGFMHRLRQLWALREFGGLEWSIENGDRAEFLESIEKIRKGVTL
jgi:hypothetical protein